MLARTGVMRVVEGLALSSCVLALGACGSSSKTSSSGSSSKTPGAAANSPSTPAAGATLAVSVKETGAGRVAFTAPASISGGVVSVQFTNSGKKLHMAQIIGIDPGHTIRDAFKILAGNTAPTWLHGLGGVGGTGPGASRTAQVVLHAGTYYIVDAGMNTSKGFAKFQVQGSGSAAALPSTQATIVAQEIGPMKTAFKISGLKAGDNEITLQSPASNKELHQFAMIPLLPGTKLSAVKKYLSAPGKPSGPPPFAGRPGQGGTDAAVIDPGLSEITHVTLKTGSSYAVLCFISDREGGPPHFMQGMLAKVDIK